MSLNWNGVIPALTTKFTKDDELDLKLFEKNLNAQTDAGVSGIIIGGSLGEASTLSIAEKETLVKFAVSYMNDKLPVIVNIAEGATKEAIALAQSAEKWGADGLMLLPPMRYKSTDEETVKYFKDVASATSLPIILYNNPVDYKTEITLEMFEQLADVPNIQAVKESTRDVTNVTRMKNKFGDRFKILCGVDTLTFEELAAGADGLVAGLVCAFPKETVAIYKFIKEEKYKEALEVYRWFMPLLEFDINPQLVQYIKLTEVYTGIGSEYVRLPRLPLSGKKREDAVKVIEDALKNRPFFD
ncbi:dihydrodipicolinate synthase family protein [Arachidicoccus ginsenosidimutans]|uniref:dihydrodipicolinate synthase family protein n=1 Tax=Arachidicoccus sp. BS20 TaxID=1850526 RepID=UPI0007F161A5|nr:dihydrodipicolinate synthase family protein [Arachidicoccus sp. BS20]ANI89099.1 dihydrodipicolinate synthase family protein [Arachidicoccus sp. BS20]